MRILTALFIMVVFAAPAFAEGPVSVNGSGKDHAAAHGYDVVAYFTESAPTKGSKEFSVKGSDGATYYFSSAENQALFEADQAKYMPAYGGFCAYAMSRGKKVDIDPEAWDIHNGTLYLNYTKKVREDWLEEKETFIKDADAAWPEAKEKDLPFFF